MPFVRKRKSTLQNGLKRRRVFCFIVHILFFSTINLLLFSRFCDMLFNEMITSAKAYFSHERKQRTDHNERKQNWHY